MVVVGDLWGNVVVWFLLLLLLLVVMIFEMIVCDSYYYDYDFGYFVFFTIVCSSFAKSYRIEC